MVHCACTDISISETDLELSPIFMMRFAVATGCSNVGGVDTFGSARACVIRSLTICRARMRSVPGSNNRSIDETPGIDSEFNGLEPWHADQQIGLERNRDQRLHFRRRQPERLGPHLQCQRRELRHDIQGHLAHLPDARGHQDGRDRDDHGAKTQTTQDDLFHDILPRALQPPFFVTRYSA